MMKEALQGYWPPLEATLNSRSTINCNSVATAHTDPTIAEQTFLTAKDNKMNLPNSDSYRDREFAKKFFC